MQEIDSKTFENCTSLASVAIPGSVKGIGEKTFSGCTSLKSVTIPRGVSYIGESVFYGCTSLVNVGLPRSVTFIYGDTFAKCSPNLKIQYDGTKAQWEAIPKGTISKGFIISQKIGTLIVNCTDGVIIEE